MLHEDKLQRRASDFSMHQNHQEGLAINRLQGSTTQSF